MGRRVDVDHLVGSVEIADRLDLGTNELVHTWRRRYPDFPPPIARVSGTYIWDWPDIEAWVTRREGAP